MQHNLEKEAIFSDVKVQLATISWENIGSSPEQPGYALFQRLSNDHPPLRIGNVSARETLPRVRSVGLLPAGHSVSMHPIGKPLRVLYCFYDIDYFERTTEIARERWEKHAASLVALKSKRLEILMQEIHAELDQPDFAHKLLIETVTKLMLVELARHVRQLDRRTSKSGANLALVPWQLRRIEERIAASQEMGYPMLGELADLCGLSQGHLARSFKVSTGWQIHKYIAKERMKTAQVLLAEGQLSCGEVSARLGFKSPGYFSTAFRRIIGKTPSEHRRQALARRVSGPL